MIDPLAVHSFTHAPAGLAGPDADENSAVQNINVAATVNAPEKTQSAANDASVRPHMKKQPAAHEHESSSLDKALEHLNDSMKAWATGMRFDIDPDTQRIVLTLIDNESGDVLRTIPSEAALAVAKMIIQFQGNGINTKA
ncbi:flagellar protein FlaG [Paenalcaligenes niemegkensis]|uniref:flagellar protein FlaG n=1 Tax=Paenalcaligenes niemegkensis TaxID=2895469 RepID=UPI001EE8AF72|nr:flagellar protein FlaG [Paenalcaligenes niemegkensis]MCQ9616017.1 flagellar protein FlaG [Paenalcaligenes niemegkensis]